MSEHPWIVSFHVDDVGDVEYDSANEVWTVNGEDEGHMAPRLAEFIADKLSESGTGVTWKPATHTKGVDGS